MKQVEALLNEVEEIFKKYNYNESDSIEFIEWLEDHEDMKEIKWDRKKESPYDIEEFFIDYKHDEKEFTYIDDLGAYLLEKEYYQNLL